MDEPESLEQLLEMPHLRHMQELLSSKEVLLVCEERLNSSRAALLEFLREIGLRRINQRQQIANAFSRALRSRVRDDAESSAEGAQGVEGAASATSDALVEPLAALLTTPHGGACHQGAASEQRELAVRPSDAHLWLTPCNWHICDAPAGGATGAVEQMAVSACPGSYLRVRWEGGLSSCDTVHLEVDTSAPTMEYMTLSYAFDGGDPLPVVLPHGNARARIELVSEQPLGPGPHELWVAILNSRQSIDRWGGNGDLPDGALRLRAVLLPPGARTLPPRPKPRRALFFGDSITEGVGSEFGHGSTGDLLANASTTTWASRVASALDAECSVVGFGRLGWTQTGNGNVPPFVSGDDARPSSWNQVWAGVPRTFYCGAAALDYVFVMLGTNDGLVAGRGASHAVRRAVETWLPAVRQQIGPDVKLFVCVPFGGFGSHAPPRRATLSAFDQYMSRHDDHNAFLLDLGPEASTGLNGFQFGERGMFAGTDESCDGIHPRTQRHCELGNMVAAAVRRLLDRDASGGQRSQTLKQLNAASRTQVEQTDDILREGAPSSPVPACTGQGPVGAGRHGSDGTDSSCEPEDPEWVLF